MLPVCAYTQAINIRTMANSATNESMNGSRYFPCGEAAPKKSITGKCHVPHKTPSVKPALTNFFSLNKLGNAKPVHPISSKKPAGMANKKPSAKKFGENAGERKFVRTNSNRIIRHGGKRANKYQVTGTLHLTSRDLRLRNPCLPLIIAVKRML